MASVKLEFAQFGDFTSFDILRSLTPMSLASLPSPIATGLTTMFYEDFAVVSGATYYYRVVTHYLTESFVSDEVSLVATEDPYLSYVVAHLPLRGNLLDLRGNADWSIIGSNANYSLTNDGLDLNGTASTYLWNPSTALCNMGTGDYCVEMYLRIDVDKNVTLICDGAAGWQPGCSVANLENLLTRHVIFGPPVVKGGNAYPLATLQHLAITKNNGVFRSFFNGIKAFESNYDYATNFSYLGTCLFGAKYSETIDGLVRDLRITKGHARYTSNFIPSVY